MPPFEKHIFICTHQRAFSEARGSCQAKGAEKIRDCFKNEVKKRGLSGKIRANASGCLDHCEQGPTVVVYPEGVWYQVKTQAEAQEIMDEHIEKNQIVERLAIYPAKT